MKESLNGGCDKRLDKAERGHISECTQTLEVIKQIS